MYTHLQKKTKHPADFAFFVAAFFPRIHWGEP